LDRKSPDVQEEVEKKQQENIMDRKSPSLKESVEKTQEGKIFWVENHPMYTKR
jgi:hypothetical protein